MHNQADVLFLFLAHFANVLGFKKNPKTYWNSNWASHTNVYPRHPIWTLHRLPFPFDQYFKSLKNKRLLSRLDRTLRLSSLTFVITISEPRRSTGMNGMFPFVCPPLPHSLICTAHSHRDRQTRDTNPHRACTSVRSGHHSLSSCHQISGNGASGVAWQRGQSYGEQLTVLQNDANADRPDLR